MKGIAGSYLNKKEIVLGQFEQMAAVMREFRNSKYYKLLDG